MSALAFIQGCSFETALTQDHFEQVSEMFRRVEETDSFGPSLAGSDHGFCLGTLIW
jgi:hypothetical protein